VHFDINSRTAAVVPETGVMPAASVLDDLMRNIPQERSVAAGLATGHLQPMNWSGAAQPWTWKDAIEAAVSVAVAYGAQVQARASAQPGWHPGRCAELVLDQNGEQWPIGWAGELHPRVIEAWSLPVRSVAFEVYTDALEAWQETLTPAPFGMTIPSAPVVKEDVALVVPQQVTAAAVEQALRQGCGPLLESISIFDEYQGNQVPNGHKSLAFALRFRHPERSLRDDEVATLREAGIASAAMLCSAVLRGR
jgi:phenylalanyl-tRNA synthetase beta chain